MTLLTPRTCSKTPCIPQKQPPASTAVSLAGADDFGASTAAAGIALLIASALAQPETPASAVTSTSMQTVRKVDFMAFSTSIRPTIRFGEGYRYNAEPFTSAESRDPATRPVRRLLRFPECTRSPQMASRFHCNGTHK